MGTSLSKPHTSESSGTSIMFTKIYHIAGFFMAGDFHFNFSWVDILEFGATLHRICTVEEIVVELILVL